MILKNAGMTWYDTMLDNVDNFDAQSRSPEECDAALLKRHQSEAGGSAEFLPAPELLLLDVPRAGSATAPRKNTVPVSACGEPVLFW
jgi:hypothetical protein